MEKLYKHFPFRVLRDSLKLLSNYDLQRVVIKREDWLSPKVRLDFPILETINESKDLPHTLDASSEFVFIRATRITNRLDNSNAREISLCYPHEFHHVVASVTTTIRPCELDTTFVSPSSICISSLGTDVIIEQNNSGKVLEPDQIYSFLTKFENGVLDCIISGEFQ